jgi:septal ring factor EnvC (AmiA/AmiB activator)
MSIGSEFMKQNVFTVIFDSLLFIWKIDKEVEKVEKQNHQIKKQIKELDKNKNQQNMKLKKELAALLKQDVDISCETKLQEHLAKHYKRIRPYSNKVKNKLPKVVKEFV